MEQMFIPTRIKVGFQTRGDTFTGKLAYIIYYDEKGVIRKEGSWKSWCDATIASIEFENKPQAGFIFNKGVQRDGYWGSGRSVVRVYDPRDFEFEITVDNLIGILMHSDVSKRDIVESCVFAWTAGKLVLLPTNSEEYQKSLEYTAKQSQKVSAKSLVAGHTYGMKKSKEKLLYIGYHEWFDWTERYGLCSHKSKGKKHVFHNGCKFVAKSPNDLSEELVSSVADNYAQRVQDFLDGLHSQPIVDIKIKKGHTKEYYIYKLYPEKGHMTRVSLNHYSKKVEVSRTIMYDYNLTASLEVSKKDILGPSGYSHYHYDVHDRELEQGIKSLIDAHNDAGKDVYQLLLDEYNMGTLHFVLKNGKEFKSQH